MRRPHVIPGDDTTPVNSHEASGGYSASPTCLAIHGATIFSKILPSGHSDDRPMWPPPGLTQAPLGDPACSIRSRSAIGTWASLSPLTSSMGAEGRSIRPNVDRGLGWLLLVGAVLRGLGISMAYER